LTGIHRQSGLSRDSIRALRGLLKLIFDHAITMGILDRNTVNPVLGTKVPRSFALAKQPSETHAYTLPEIFGMLNVLEEPARTAVATAAFTGVRRGELAGLLWEDFNPKGCVSENGATMGSIKISRSVWEPYYEPQDQEVQGGNPDDSIPGKDSGNSPHAHREAHCRADFCLGHRYASKYE